MRVFGFLLALILGAVLAGNPAKAQSPSDDSVLVDLAGEPWTGDLDGMVDRGFVRILTVFNPLFFAYNGDAETGMLADANREFQKRLSKWYGKKGKLLTVITIPVPRDQLIPMLVEGRGDIIVANMTVTPERGKLVDFANPNFKGISELVVTGPAAGAIKSFDDLAEVGVTTRKSSSYFEHLTGLNAEREKAGKKPIPVDLADEVLEDHDLLDMVSAGVIPAVIVDSHKAELWAQIIDNLTIHETLAVNKGGEIAWAIRKDSPKLMEAVNRFNKEIRKGSLLGNILIKRYFGNTEWMENNLSEEARGRYENIVPFIKKYAGQYDFDWLMVAAQGYQESRLDQSKVSHAGAVGVMQVMPTTAKDPVVGIPNIHDAEKNVHAGVKYLRFLRERYFNDPEISPADRVLMSFAAYNAGPGGISRARKRAVKMNLDPNVWFGNVEVAAARAISREPVIYVRNIMKYYVTYRRAIDLSEQRQKVKAGSGD